MLISGRRTGSPRTLDVQDGAAGGVPATVERLAVVWNPRSAADRPTNGGRSTGRCSRSACSPSWCRWSCTTGFPAYSWNRDEPVYLWQAAALRDGILHHHRRGIPDVLPPVAGGRRRRLRSSRSTRSAGRWSCWPPTSWSARRPARSRSAPRSRWSARTCSPASSSTTARCPLLAALRDARVADRGDPERHVPRLPLHPRARPAVRAPRLLRASAPASRGRLVVAGLLVGWIFMTRPFDAVLWGVGASWSRCAWTHRREPRRLLACRGAARARVPAAAGRDASPTTRTSPARSPQFPITAADPLDTFGFGLRRIMPTFGERRLHVGSRRAAAPASSGLCLPLFLAGSYVLGAAGAVGPVARRRDRAHARAARSSCAAFPIGYFFFWGMYVSSVDDAAERADLLHPAVRAARRAHRHRDRHLVAAATARSASPRSRSSRWSTVPFAVNRIDVNRRISESQIPWRDGADAVHGKLDRVRRSSRAPTCCSSTRSRRTRANLDGRILWATDQGAEQPRPHRASPRSRRRTCSGRRCRRTRRSPTTTR